MKTYFFINKILVDLIIDKIVKMLFISILKPFIKKIRNKIKKPKVSVVKVDYCYYLNNVLLLNICEWISIMQDASEIIKACELIQSEINNLDISKINSSTDYPLICKKILGHMAEAREKSNYDLKKKIENWNKRYRKQLESITQLRKLLKNR